MVPRSLHTGPRALPEALRARLEAALGGELELPLLPATAVDVMAMCQDEDCDARGLARLLERDPSLAGQVLNASNSSAYAPREPIVSLQHAISRLGIGTIREIAIAVSLRSRVFSVPGHDAEVRAMWRHAAVTGAYAREVARHLRRNVEAAFLCGLMHDVGRPLILTTVFDQLGDEACSPAVLERALDEYHGRFGRRLVEHWSLAGWVAESAAHHHDPERAQAHVEEARITCLADMLGHWALGEDPKPEQFPTGHPVVDALNLYGEDLRELLDRRERVLELASVLE